MPLEDDELGGRVLLVPDNEREEIRRQSSTAAEERERLICYYLNYSEYASWGHLAGRLYHGQHHDALSAARRFIKTEPGEFMCNNNYIPVPINRNILANLWWNYDEIDDETYDETYYDVIVVNTA